MLNDDSNRARSDPPLVLVGAADDSFASFIEFILRDIGLHTMTVNSGKALAAYLEQHRPDILLVESNLANVDVCDLCARLRLDRRTRTMTIVIFAAEGDERHETEVLESGADQYLRRPFSPGQLVTSIQAALPDGKHTLQSDPRTLLTFFDLELDLASYRVRRGGRDIRLAPTEFRLLHHLMKNPRRVYSREELQHAAWPRAVNVGPRTVDVHIGRLRAALNEAAATDLIRTVRSVGYALSD
jgi:two-component system, OmpR family, phosphate regulon response regulator PhoB